MIPWQLIKFISSPAFEELKNMNICLRLSTTKKSSSDVLILNPVKSLTTGSRSWLERNGMSSFEKHPIPDFSEPLEVLK